MARITISLLDSEALSYLQPMQVESISGNLLDEIEISLREHAVF